MSKANMPKSKRLKSFVISLVLFGMVFTSSPAAIFSVAKSAQAIAPIPAQLSVVVEDLPSIWEQIARKVLFFVERAGKILYKNALDYFLQRIAYDTATFLATGDKGQKPLYWDEGLGGYLLGIADEAAGDALDDFARSTFGVSLCEPPSPTIKLNLILQAKRTVEPRRAVCTFNDILKTKLIRITGAGNQEIDLRKLSHDDFYQLANYFRPEANELGMFFQLQTNIKTRQAEDKELATLIRSIESDLKSLKSPIGDLGFEAIKTPAAAIQEWLSASTKQSLESGWDVLTGDIAADALRTFTNTLASKYLDRLRKGLLAGKGGSTGGGPGDYNAGSSFATRGAQALYAEFIIPSFRGGGQIDILGTLSSCPPDVKSRLYNNCIIDNNLATAIEQQLTVREAIERGYLDSNKPFGFLSDGSEPDYKNGYPYRSLVFLRKYRIIPVTWELAALYLRDIAAAAETKTLADIMGRPEADFDIFGRSDSPFYHLIDPNWVLKVPDYQCRIQGPGPQILERRNEQVSVPDGLGETVNQNIEIIQRADYCADERSCIVENPDGSCNQYGYCTNERSIWRFNGDACQPSQATCETYVSGAGGKFSYLASTLDSCDSGQVGCRWYSVYQTANDDWAEDIWNEQAGVFGSDGAITFGDVFNRSDYGNVSYARYFNNQVSQCSSSDGGCQKFLELTDLAAPSGYEGTTQSIYQYVQANPDLYVDATYWGAYGEWGRVNEKYLKLAPPNLNCPVDITDPDRDYQCDNYAQSCNAVDVGCSLYTPVNGDPPIPAVLQPNDYCSKQCVGYDQYLEEPTYFELWADPSVVGQVKNLIPASAQSCRAQAVGCERFTNLDKVAKGGEGIEYYTYLRNCISPNDPSAKVYYTWEGSDTTGYQLKTWRLQASGGGPTGDSCSPAPNNLACRTFIDANGSTYDRDINTVIFATEDCHPFRREVDSSIIYGIESLSASCRAADVGCHEYRGNTGNVVTVVINDDFESGTSEGWANGANSNESVYVGGHSLSTNSKVVMKRVNTLIAQDKSYTLSFWAKSISAGGATLEFEIQAYLVNVEARAPLPWDLIPSAQAAVPIPIPGSERSFGTVSVPGEWQYFRMGPMRFDRAVEAYEFLQTNGADVYLDNIIMREITDSYYLIKDSGNTPAECDQPFFGAQLGCQAYDEQPGQRVNLLGFSSLCSDRAVGCKALIDTQNSDSPFTEDFNTENNDLADPQGLDDVTIPNDSLVYLVDDKDKYCSSDKAGCKLVGQAILDRQTDTVVGFGDNYIVDSPKKYHASLCQVENLYCQQYVNERTLATSHFVDPGKRLCEFKSLPGSGQLAWYRQGTDILCDLNFVCADDMLTSCTVATALTDCGAGISCIATAPNQPTHNTSAFYDGWVGSCSEEAKGCSQYIDPEGEKFCTDNQTLKCLVDSDCGATGLCRPHPTKQSYYYLEQSVDAAFCNGIVDRERGCLLFNKTDGNPPAYTANAWPSSLTEDGQTPTPATDSALNDSNIILKVQKDRTCDEWLYCRTRIESVDSEDNRDDKCLDIGLCDSLDANGECIGFPPLATTTGDIVVEVIGQQINGAVGYSSPYTVEDLRTMSGLTKAGMSWSGYGTGDGVVPGYLPYSAMQQVGNQSNVLKNGGFENIRTPVGLLGSPFVSWSTASSSCAAGSGCSISAYNRPADGLYAARLSAQGTGGDNILQLSQSLSLSPSKYILSGYIRWEGLKASATGFGGFNMQVIEGSSGALVGQFGQRQDSSNGWEKFAFSFQNNSTSTTINLLLTGVGAGEAYFDGLEILPALQVTNSPDEILVGQTCRMYSQSDSPECSYTKAGKSYIGWPGFCVEPDPKNPSHCVNWWPVDIIQGSLAQINETPLTFSEKVPLYYCAESAGRESSDVALNAVGLNYSHDNYKYTVNRKACGLLGGLLGCGLLGSGNDWWLDGGQDDCNDLEGLSSNSFAFGGCSRSCANSDYPCYTTIDLTTYSPLPPEYAYSDIKEYEIEKIVLNGIPSDHDEYPQVVILTRANRMNRPAVQSFDSQAADFMAEADTAWIVSCSWTPWGAPAENSSGRSNDLPVDGACSAAANRLKFAVVFNQEGRLRGYYWYMDDYSGNGNEAEGWTITYFLRESCTNIVQVARLEENGEITTVPYWSRVNPLGNYSLPLPGATTEYYNYKTDSNPFGSSYQSGLSAYRQDESDPITWDSRLKEFGKQPLYVEAANTATINDGTTNYGPNIRAGTPYACGGASGTGASGTCDYSICVGGPNEGQPCVSDESAKACYVGDGMKTGICVGSWQASQNVNNQTFSSYGRGVLKNLYAQSFGGWSWQYISGQGWSYQPNGSLGWNDKASGTLPEIGNITINDQTPPYSLSSPGTIKLTFTSNINNDQLPLREYTVDWGDTTPKAVVQGYFEEKLSPKNPHVLHHTYNATGDYTIIITVKDNWDQEGSASASMSILPADF